jgi:short-subunit dehydrogenase
VETVLITGASSGLGGEFARLFAAEGASLILVARRADKLEALAAELRAQHLVNVRVVTKDLATATAARELFEELQEVAVDVLVNNAGFGERGSFVDLPLERQIEMVQLNTLSLMVLARLYLPTMVARGRGGVLNIGSSAAFQPDPYMAVYGATKAFVLSMSEAIAEELRNSPVTVTCLCPGPTKTEFGEKSTADRALAFRLGTMPAAEVARAGLRAFRKGRVYVEPGLWNQVLTFSGRFAARPIVRRITRRLLQ